MSFGVLSSHRTHGVCFATQWYMSEKCILFKFVKEEQRVLFYFWMNISKILTLSTK